MSSLVTTSFSEICDQADRARQFSAIQKAYAQDERLSTAEKIFQAMRSGHVLFARERGRESWVVAFCNEAKTEALVFRQEELPDFFASMGEIPRSVWIAKAHQGEKDRELRIRIVQERAWGSSFWRKWSGRISAHMGAASDFISSARNIAGAATTRGAILGGAILGIAQAPLAFGVGGRLAYQGLRGVIRGMQIRNPQQIISEASGSVGGSALAGFGVALGVKSGTALKLAALSGGMHITPTIAQGAGVAKGIGAIVAAKGVMAAASSAILPLGLILYLGFLGKGIANLISAFTFRNQFQRAKQLGSEALGNFLRGQVTLSEQEIIEISKLPCEKQKIEISRILEKKYEQFKRNTNQTVLQEVLSEEFNNFICRLNMAKTPAERYLIENEKKEVFFKIDEANFQTTLSALMLTGICFIGLLGIIAAFCSPAGPATAIILAIVFASTSLLWLAIDIPKIFEKICRRLYIEDRSLGICTKLGKKDFLEEVILCEDPCKQLNRDFQARVGPHHLPWCTIGERKVTSLVEFSEALKVANGGKELSEKLFLQIASFCQQGSFAKGVEYAKELFPCMQIAGGRAIDLDLPLSVVVTKELSTYKIILKKQYVIYNDTLDAKGRIEVTSQIECTPDSSGNADPSPRYRVTVDGI